MLAIAGGKGGCGKTTTAIGLAHAMARNGDTPLVADADVEMPDVHVVADVPTEPGLRAVARGQSLETATHRTRLDGVSAAPAAGIDETDLPSALTRLRGWPGHTVVDCPAGAARDAAVPLRVADRTLLVTTPSSQCVLDTVKTAAMARTLGAQPIGIVVVCARGAPESPGPPFAARSAFECPLLGRVPPGRNRPLTAGIVRSAFDRVAKKINKRNI
jgi:septum site-determining protein MinD